MSTQNRPAKRTSHASTSVHLPEQKGTITFGIDFGTTRSCIAVSKRAFGAKKPGRIETFGRYSTSYATNQKQPITALLYRDGRLPVTGDILEKILDDPAESEAINTDRLLTTWKVLFVDNLTDPALLKLQNELRRKMELLGKTRRNLLEDWFDCHYLKIFNTNDDGELELPLRYRDDTDEREFDLELVLSIPPGWTIAAKDEFF